MVLRSVASILSPEGARARLSILIFHRVLPVPDPLFPGEQDARRFDETLGWVGRLFRVLPLDEAVRRLAKGSLPSRAACITFDDGYADNATHALPLLQLHGMTATFFVATSFLDGGRMWNDSVIEAIRLSRYDVLDLREAGLGRHPLTSNFQRQQAIDKLLAQIKYLDPSERVTAVQLVERKAGAALPADLMMSSNQVRQLRDAGMQIGAHTSSHPILARLSDVESDREIRGSKTMLESLLSEPVSLFAYPNGKPNQDYRAAHVAMAKAAGFVAAVSTAPGVSTEHSDVYQLPRFSPWDRTRTRYGVRLVANLRNTQPETV